MLPRTLSMSYNGYSSPIDQLAQGMDARIRPFQSQDHTDMMAHMLYYKYYYHFCIRV